MENTQRVIITGGPGTGKTALIEYLRAEGYPCFTERARATIKEQLALKSNLVPWEKLVDFSILVQQRQQQDYEKAIPNSLNFYDRGMPDVLAYLHRENHYIKALEDAAKKHNYHNQVFITPPWEKIYAQDNERREDLNTMISIHLAIANTYQTLGYTVIEVPKISITERIAFIKNHLGI